MPSNKRHRAARVQKGPTEVPGSRSTQLMGPRTPGDTASMAPTGPRDMVGSRAAALIPATLPGQQSRYNQAAGPQPPTYISDVDLGSNTFSPFQPVTPFGPPSVNYPRTFDYPVGLNLDFSDQGRVAFYKMLQVMSRTWGILRSVIETRKDQIMRIPWDVQLIGKPKVKDHPRLNELRAFLKRPDKEHSFNQWMRMQLEDKFVIDAANYYVWKDVGGKPIALMHVEGSLIKPLIDDAGRRPVYPNPAWQERIKGLPWINLDENEFLYAIQRPTPQDPIHGFSECQMIYIEVLQGIRKMLWKLDYWTEGSIPQMIITTPDGWSPEQVASFQAHTDFMLSGNLPQRAKIRFMPSGSKPFDLKNANGEALKTDEDEWVTRLVCYVFSVPPTPFVRQQNRACYSADTETLTDDGWKFYPDVGTKTKIATLNPELRRIEYYSPKKLHVYPYRGKMHHFVSRAVDVCVTPDHDMWCRDPRRNAYKKRHAEDLPEMNVKFVASATWEGGEDTEFFVLPACEVIRPQDHYVPIKLPMDLWLRFLGFFISQGGLSHHKNHYMFTLAQRFGEGERQIDETLKALEFSYSKYPPSDENCARWNVYGKQLHTWLLGNCGGYANEKHLPRWIFGLCLRQRRILFDALMAGDGSWDKRPDRNGGSYTSVSPQLVDDVQELAFTIGYCATMSVHYEANENKQRCYRVSVCERDEHDLLVERCREIEDYDGMVYCFEVPPNALFVTRRNGRIGIHGNTAESAAQEAQEEGLHPLMTWAKDDLIDPAIQSPTLGFGYDDCEFVWLPEPEVDAVKQSTVLTSYAKIGMITYDEGREQLNMGPLPDGTGSQPIMDTPNGPVPLAETLEANRQKALAAPDELDRDSDKHDMSMAQQQQSLDSAKQNFQQANQNGNGGQSPGSKGVGKSAAKTFRLGTARRDRPRKGYGWDALEKSIARRHGKVGRGQDTREGDEGCT